MHRVRILIVEDERKLAEVLASALQAERYETVVAPTGEDGFFRANAETFDLVLLDLMLPGRGGLEILETLRKRDLQTPVLILTARDGIEDRVQGLDLGADDYLVKPFALPELLARIRALLRRGGRGVTVTHAAGDLRLDPATHRCFRGEEEITLTAREFATLEYLLRRVGEVVSKTEILDNVWDFAFDGDPNIVEVYVRHLRRKLDEPFGRQLIQTIRGVGYRLDPSGG